MDKKEQILHYYRVDGMSLRGDRALVGRERPPPSDRHAQAVPKAAGHLLRPNGERF